MAWDRVAQLIIGVPHPAENTIRGVEISNLDISFKVERSITLAENTAEFTIYNTTQSTRNDILKMGNNVIFKLGYKDEAISTVFAGNIVEAESKVQGYENETKIMCIAKNGNAELKVQPVGLSYAPGTFASRPLRDLAALSGLIISGLPNADVPMPNGLVYAGNINGGLRYIRDILAKQGITFYIDNNEMVVYRQGQNSVFREVLITPECGLKTAFPITDQKDAKEKKAGAKTVMQGKKRVQFESIIVPQCTPGGIVVLKSAQVNGVFTVEKLTFEGDNFGGNFDMVGEAVE